MKRWVAPIAALAAAGCVSVLPEPPSPPRIYTLAAAPSGPAALAPRGDTGPVLAVAAPLGPRALMGAELVWRRHGVLAYVERAEWASRAPDLLQTLLVDTIDAQGVARAGVRAGVGVRADYEVQWDLAAFEVREEDEALEAVIAGAAKLVDARTRELVATTRFDSRSAIADRSTRLAAEALERVARDAADHIARTLAEQAVDQASAASINR